MKKKNCNTKTLNKALFLFVLLLSSTITVFSQSQLKKWHFNSEGVDFSGGLPQVYNIPAGALSASGATNGMSSPGGDLFYVLDNRLVDKNGGTIDFLLLTSSYLGAEITIVPVPENCKKFFVIYNDIDPNTHPFFTNNLRYSEVDMNLGSGLGGVTPGKNGLLLGTISSNGHGGIAVSKLKNNNTRNLYFGADEYFITGGGKIYKYEINSTGIVNQSLFYQSTSNIFANAELELSHDESMLAFASLAISSPDDVTIIHLDANGNINTTLGNNGISSFSISGSAWDIFTGLEFSGDNTKLFVGSFATGVYWIDLINNVVGNSGNIILNTDINNMGDSQLELGYNGWIYAATSANQLRAIDPFPSLPVLATGNGSAINFTSNAVVRNFFTSNMFGNGIWTIPDQIDGENYDDVFGPGTACCVEYNVYDKTNFTAPASAVWDQNQNPINNGAGPTVTIRDELRIPAGTTVTIDNMIFKFAPTGYVVIEQGAKLILNTTTFTIDDRCEDDQMWGGIQVWGTTNQNQFPSGNPTFQGIIDVKNSSLIEHAGNAITTWKPNDWNTRGGVVLASNSTFKNNKRSVEFMSYHNTFPSPAAPPHRNLSSFYNVTFTVDDDFIGNSFNTHVTMWDVNGVTFRWCKFENNQTNKIFSATENKGIFSIDAGYIVGASCNITPPPNQPCPPANLLRSSFKGFNFAVHAVGTGTLYAVNVDQSDFDENVYGVYMEGSNNFSATRSNYIIGGNNASGAWPIRNGIYSNVSTGYRIEENNMSNAAFPLGLMIGFWVRNSGHADNQVYKNTSRSIDVGELGHGLNRNPNNAQNGLQILCNTHSSLSRNDIFVTKDPSGQANDHGIRQFQGDPSKSAGNIFSQMNLPESDFSNQSPWVIDYFHTGGITQPLTYTQFMVNPFQITTANTCPSRFNNDREKLTETERQDLSDEYDNQKLSYLNLLYNYNQLMDGGDKNALLTQIQLSWPQDAWDLRDELMSHAPYLSEEVLREAAMKDILPHAMLLEVCLANPDATKSDEFLKFLQYDIPSPMPLYMIDLIRANWETETARTLLEGGMAHFSGEMASIANILANDYTKDEEPNFNQIRYW